MSSNVHYTQISDPQLLDIVDEAWLRDKLPDDSEYLACAMCTVQTKAAAGIAVQSTVADSITLSLLFRWFVAQWHA